MNMVKRYKIREISAPTDIETLDAAYRNAAMVLASDYDSVAAELADAKQQIEDLFLIDGRSRARIAALEAALRYWLPDLNEIDVAAEEYERWRVARELLGSEPETFVTPAPGTTGADFCDRHKTAFKIGERCSKCIQSDRGEKR
jgi:hypothetical protein